MNLDHEFLDRLETYGPIARTLSMCLRPTFCAEDENHTLVWGDWSSIEARMLPWLADNPGSREILDIFRRVDADPLAADIYMREAGNIHGIDPEEINGRILEAKRERYKNNETVQAAAKEAKGWRQEGKVAVLALGFGGGVGALMAMATGYGLYFSEDRAQHIVTSWRDANGWAKRFWDELNNAFMNAFENPGVAYKAGKLTYIHDSSYHGGTTFCVQPCGRVLSYPNLKWRTVTRTNRQGEDYEQDVITYRKGYKWGSIWHGILCLTGDTLVATNKGWVRLDAITAAHQVWDGIEFVTHCGLIDKGKSRTINIDGVKLTPDHEILTAEGWRHASQCEGLERPKVRLPDGYTPRKRRADKRQKKVAGFSMAIPMRLRFRDRTTRERGRSWKRNVSGAVRKIQNSVVVRLARYVGAPSLRCVGLHESAVYAALTRRVGQLWRSGRQSLGSVVSVIHCVLVRHGRLVPCGADFGQDRQQRRLHTFQLPMGNAPRTTGEHARQPTSRHEKSKTVNRYFRQYATLSVGERSVYDLTNCGPPARFVVKSDAGPMIVHNCENPVQGTAASILRAKLRHMEADRLSGASQSFETRFHTHDEIGGQCRNDDEAFARAYVKRVMDEPLDWSEGLPLVSEISSHWAYTKAVE